jgi:hypothetical protein
MFSIADHWVEVKTLHGQVPASRETVCMCITRAIVMGVQPGAVLSTLQRPFPAERHGNPANLHPRSPTALPRSSRARPGESPRREALGAWKKHRFPLNPPPLHAIMTLARE